MPVGVEHFPDFVQLELTALTSHQIHLDLSAFTIRRIQGQHPLELTLISRGVPLISSKALPHLDTGDTQTKLCTGIGMGAFICSWNSREETAHLRLHDMQN